MINCRLQRIQRDKHTVPFVIVHPKPHTSNELTYFISGRGTTGIEGRVYPYKSKTFAFYRAGTMHDENDPEPCQVIWTHFDYEIDGIELKEGVFEDPRGELLALIQQLRNLYLVRGAYREILLEGCLAQVIAVAARLQREQLATRTEVDWQEVVDYIDENSNTTINFASLSVKYGYSYDRFRHLFCEKFGLPPHAYLLCRRIERAKYLLVNTVSELTDIAYDCGFSSSSQFSNIFKKHVGLTPGAYRRDKKKTIFGHM